MCKIHYVCAEVNLFSFQPIETTRNDGRVFVVGKCKTRLAMAVGPGGIRRLSATTPTAATTTTTVRDGAPTVRPSDDPATAGCAASRRDAKNDATERRWRRRLRRLENFTLNDVRTLLSCSRKTVANKREKKQTSRYQSDLSADVCKNGPNETEKTRCFF